MPRGVPKSGVRKPRVPRVADPLPQTLAPPATQSTETTEPSEMHTANEQHDVSHYDPLQRGHSIDRMDEAALRLYARRIGLTQRDADSLTVERLRMNCKARLVELVEAD